MLRLAYLLRQLPLPLRRKILKNRTIAARLEHGLAAAGAARYRYRGREIHVDLADALGREMLLHGFTEAAFLRLVQRYCCDREACFVDIGANLGNYALALAPYFARTLAFEANPQTYRLLERNVAANPELTIEPIAMGLSDRRTTLSFFPNDAGNSGASGFEQPREHSQALQIPVCPGDDYRERFTPRIGAIKIDVEGHELEVLRGLSASIAADRPIVFLEWLTTRMQAKGGFEALHALLPGYELFVPCAYSRRYPEGKPNAPRHRRTRLAPLRPPYLDKYNLLFCFPEEKRPAL